MLPFCCHRGLLNGEKPLFTGFFSGVILRGKTQYSQKGNSPYSPFFSFSFNFLHSLPVSFSFSLYPFFSHFFRVRAECSGSMRTNWELREFLPLSLFFFVLGCQCTSKSQCTKTLKMLEIRGNKRD